MNVHRIPIGLVERDTGISKEVLRKWELRYGFPVPKRNDRGVRLYSAAQLERLRAIKRLLDTGMRPAQAHALDDTELARLGNAIRRTAPADATGALVTEIIQVLARDEVPRLHGLLAREQMRRGAHAMVLDVLAPLTRAVGDAWAEGRLHIRHEHAYAEAVQGLLHTVNSGLPRLAERPLALLATPPGELHTLGLLMLQTLLGVHGVRCVSLGAQVPANELVEGVASLRPEVVGISFSSAYPARQVVPYLADVTGRLPRSVMVWAGGAGAAAARRLPPRVTRLVTLEAALAEMPGLAAASP